MPMDRSRAFDIPDWPVTELALITLNRLFVDLRDFVSSRVTYSQLSPHDAARLLVFAFTIEPYAFRKTACN